MMEEYVWLRLLNKKRIEYHLTIPGIAYIKRPVGIFKIVKILLFV
jgi:hypothetical protein